MERQQPTRHSLASNLTYTVMDRGVIIGEFATLHEAEAAYYVCRSYIQDHVLGLARYAA